MGDVADDGNSYWARVEEIFHQALDRPAGDRPAFIRERCAGDRELEGEVMGILQGYEAQDRMTSASAAGAREGARFGAFEIIRKIGEGGMGVVYLARRVEDF